MKSVSEIVTECPICHSKIEICYCNELDEESMNEKKHMHCRQCDIGISLKVTLKDKKSN